MEKIQSIIGIPHRPVSAEPRLQNIRLITGNSHPDLAKKISSHLELPLTQADVGRFSNSEIQVRILDNVRRRDVVIVQTGAFRPEKNYSVNDAIMEIVILANTLVLSSVDSITLVCPCYPYARQDRKAVSRTPISGRAVADLFESVGITRIITIDLHASQIAGFFKIPVDNLYSVNVFKEWLQHDQTYKKLMEQEQLVLVSPDAGGTRRVDSLAQRLSLPTVIMHKVRDYLKKNTVNKTVLIGENNCVKGKSCLIYDDMVDTGGTICQAGQTLMDNGAKDVRILVVHGVLSGPAIERLNSHDYISEIIVTNSLPQEENLKHCSKLRVIDISPLLAETVCNLFSGESISRLFD